MPPSRSRTTNSTNADDHQHLHADYERTNDFATFRISRLGDLNAPSYNVNIALTGTATSNVDYYVDVPAAFDPGVQSFCLRVKCRYIFSFNFIGVINCMIITTALTYIC